MKVLLDEDLPHKLRQHLPGEVFTVAYMGWGGLKNGELLRAAEDAGFDVLVTGDQSMPHEQNVDGRKLAIVALSAIEWPIIKHHTETSPRRYRRRSWKSKAGGLRDVQQAKAKPGRAFSRVDRGVAYRTRQRRHYARSDAVCDAANRGERAMLVVERQRE